MSVTTVLKRHPFAVGPSVLLVAEARTVRSGVGLVPTNNVKTATPTAFDALVMFISPSAVITAVYVAPAGTSMTSGAELGSLVGVADVVNACVVSVT